MKLSFEQYQELQRLHQHQPRATVMDIMAALDVSDTRAERLLAEYNSIIHSIEHPLYRVNGVPVYGHGSMAAMLIGTAYDKLECWLLGVDASESEQAAARASVPTCIILGKFRERIGSTTGGAQNLIRGNYVFGYAAGGDPVYCEWVACSQRYEPETRNRVGSMGAWREIPDDGGIQQAMARIAQRITA